MAKSPSLIIYLVQELCVQPSQRKGLIFSYWDAYMPTRADVAVVTLLGNNGDRWMDRQTINREGPSTTI